MIQTVIGKKGSGKTKRLIDLANDALKSERGNIIFIDDDDSYIYDLRHEIRFVNCGKQKIKGADMLYGMLCGILSIDFDITLIIIDPMMHIIENDVSQLKEVFERLEKLSSASAVNFLIAISGDAEAMPDFVKQCAIETE